MYMYICVYTANIEAATYTCRYMYMGQYACCNWLCFRMQSSTHTGMSMTTVEHICYVPWPCRSLHTCTYMYFVKFPCCLVRTNTHVYAHMFHFSFFLALSLSPSPPSLPRSPSLPPSFPPSPRCTPGSQTGGGCSCSIMSLSEQTLPVHRN